MYTVILNQKVQDYSKWLPIFEEQSDKRAKFGIRDTQVLRRTDDPNNVTVICHCDDQKSLTNFMNGPELKDTLNRSGVIGQPTWTMLNNERTYMH